MRLTASLLAIAVLSACAPHEPMTELRISTEFSAEEIEVWAEATADWCAVSRDTCLPVSVVDRGANVVRLRSLPPGWQEGSCAAMLHSSGGSRIEVAPGCTLDGYDARHEIGHALAGDSDHLDEPGNVMNGRERFDARCITDTDAEFVCARRGCRDHHGTCSVLGEADD